MSNLYVASVATLPNVSDDNGFGGGTDISFSAAANSNGAGGPISVGTWDGAQGACTVDKAPVLMLDLSKLLSLVDLRIARIMLMRSGIAALNGLTFMMTIGTRAFMLTRAEITLSSI